MVDNVIKIFMVIGHYNFVMQTCYAMKLDIITFLINFMVCNLEHFQPTGASES